MSNQKVGEAIAKGVAYLGAAQQPDGSFVTSRSHTSQPFRGADQLTTVFAPALMLGALTHVESALDVRQALASWLLAQKSEHWSFNYWPVDAPERRARSYPDDLDDTFCALIGLYAHNPKQIDSRCLAHVVRLLVAAESQVGGPYRTWLASKDAPTAWRDVDLAVNANVAYFLRQVSGSLPNVTTLMEDAIMAGNFRSPYYVSPYALVYYLARAYEGPAQKQLTRYILRRQQAGHWRTPLQTALATSALQRLAAEQPLEPAIAFLAANQQADGSWPAEAFWIDEISPVGKKVYAGSSALTTALVLEVLARYQADQPKDPPVATVKPSNHRQAHVYQAIWGRATQYSRSLPQPLCGQYLTALSRMQAIDKNQEIVLLPYLFATGLRNQPALPDELFAELGLANLYGWMAYTIYDDFLDDEGDPKLLPVANIAMRQSLEHFRQALPSHTTFQWFVADAFARIDAANAWEVTHCRFARQQNRLQIGALPRYGPITRLAERSIGHVLTPLGVLAAAGVDLKQTAVADLQRGFQHYLTARQLNDDLHDWQADIRNGHVTYVVAHMLHECAVQPGPRLLGPLVTHMERQFWRATLTALCYQVNKQVSFSRKAYRQSGLLMPQSCLTTCLDDLEATMAHTLDERQRAVDFLAAYRQDLG